MIKDTVNNVHVSTEDVLITPEALSAEILGVLITSRGRVSPLVNRVFTLADRVAVRSTIPSSPDVIKLMNWRFS